MTDKERTMIAPCGLYCGDCPLYLATIDPEMKRKIATARGVSEDKLVLCAGCRPLKGKIPVVGENVCSTYACIVSKGLEFCYECAEFPCLRLAPCADRAAELPHNTKIYNLLLLKKEGTETFVKNYRTRLNNYRRGRKPKPGGEIQL